MSTFTVLNPATEETVATVPADLGGGDRRGDRPRGGRPGGLAGGRARRPGRAAARASPTRSTRTSRSWPGSRSPARATRSARPAGKRATSGTCCATTRRRRNACAASRSRFPAALNVTFQEPVGVVGLIVPWNFPMPILGWGLAPGAGGRQPGDRQAGRADAADRDPDRRARPRGGPAGRRVPGPAGQGLGGGPAAGRPPSTSARSCSPAPPRSASRSWPAAPGR